MTVQEAKILEMQIRDIEILNEKIRNENITFEKYVNIKIVELGDDSPTKKKKKAISENLLAVYEKLEIANYVHELIVTEKETLIANSEKLIDTLRCVLEETDIRIGELKKDAYDFKRAVVIGSVNPRTGKITAEKVIRYMEDKLKQIEGIIGKLRLKNANMKAQMQSMQLQLTKKEEAGDVLHYIDFHQLQIENSQLLGKVDESNKEMLHLKISGGKTTAALNDMKSILSVYAKDSMWLQQELTSKYGLFEKMKKESERLKQDVIAEQRTANKLRLGIQESNEMPEILDYITQKKELYEAESKLKNLQKKVDIITMAAKRLKVEEKSAEQFRASQEHW